MQEGGSVTSVASRPLFLTGTTESDAQGRRTINVNNRAALKRNRLYTYNERSKGR